MYTLPNIKKLFIPDPGYVIFDMDLSGSDARVAAAECGGKFRADMLGGKKVHVETMENFYPEIFNPRRERYLAEKDTSIFEPAYTKCKNMYFGTIYVGSPRGIGAAASIPEAKVRAFQQYLFARYPEVSAWHDRVRDDLNLKKRVSNPFGYRKIFFDRPDGLLPEAVNWICQSVTGIVCQKGQILLDEEFPQAEPLLQVHDSIVFQLKQRDLSLVSKIVERLNSIFVPYPEPLFIPWSIKASRRSWGHCTSFKMEELERLAA